MNLPVVDPWFSVVQVRPGVFRITEPHCHRLVRANCFLILGDGRNLLVDSGMGVSALRPLVESISSHPISVFTTHTHIDHVGSHPEFADCDILIHRLEEEELHRPGSRGLRFPPRSPDQIAALRRGGIELTEFMTDAVPYEGYDVDAYGRAAVTNTTRVDEGDRIDIGHYVFEVLHLPGHSAGSMALWEARSGMLFPGDVIYDGVIIDTAPTSNVADYLATMRRVLTLPIATSFGGHNIPLSGDRVAEIAKQYIASKAG